MQHGYGVEEDTADVHRQEVLVSLVDRNLESVAQFLGQSRVVLQQLFDVEEYRRQLLWSEETCKKRTLGCKDILVK